MTLRTGSGALACNREVAGAGAGPDNNSGTINTMSTSKIEAPTRRSLTRRSIELISLKRKWRGAPQYIREAPRGGSKSCASSQSSAGPTVWKDPKTTMRSTGLAPANAAAHPARWAVRDFDRRRDLAANHLRQHRAAAPSLAVGGDAPPGIDAVAQFRGDPLGILVGQYSAHRKGSPPLRRCRADCAPSTRAAAGLCATSRIHVGTRGRAGAMTWKRAASRVSLSPCAIAAAGIVSRGGDLFEGGDGRRGIGVLRVARERRSGQTGASPNECRGSARCSPWRSVGVLEPETLERRADRAREFLDTAGISRLPSTAGAASPENPGLLASDGLERRAQIFLMVVADADHHRDVRIDHIDGIQAAAHADLEHPGIELARPRTPAAPPVC